MDTRKVLLVFMDAFYLDWIDFDGYILEHCVRARAILIHLTASSDTGLKTC